MPTMCPEGINPLKNYLLISVHHSKVTQSRVDSEVCGVQDSESHQQERSLGISVRETMKAIKGSKQNWKQGINLSSLASGIQKIRKDRKDPAQPKGLGESGGQSQGGEPWQEGCTKMHAAPRAGRGRAACHAVLSHFVSPALGCGSRSLRHVLIARERRGAP